MNFLMYPIKRAIALTALLAASASALAHDGHGLSGSHWHASDTMGFALVAALTVLAIWLAHRE